MSRAMAVGPCALHILDDFRSTNSFWQVGNVVVSTEPMVCSYAPSWHLRKQIREKGKLLCQDLYAICPLYRRDDSKVIEQ